VQDSAGQDDAVSIGLSSHLNSQVRSWCSARVVFGKIAADAASASLTCRQAGSVNGPPARVATRKGLVHRFWAPVTAPAVTCGHRIGAWLYNSFRLKFVNLMCSQD
jgi:hypothetical protein